MLYISIMSSFVSILLITYIMSIKGNSLPLIVYAGPFTTWFVFFMLGVFFANKTINSSTKKIITFVIIGLILECFETYWLNTNYKGGYGIKLSSFIYSASVILLILSPKMKSLYKPNKITSLVSYVGSISFGIYLIHCFVIMLLKPVFCNTSWGLFWVVVLITTSCVIAGMRTILPSKINKYLGFL